MDQYQKSQDANNAGDAGNVRPIPRISIQTFCETNGVKATIDAFTRDRRVQRTHITNHMGGIRAAIEFYDNAPTPNVIVIESSLEGEALIHELEELANVCDADTRVVVIGHKNDVELYRRLIRFGVSEYLITPIDVLDIIHTIGEMFVAPDADPLGRSIVFMPAKGGSGSSTIAQNVAWTISTLFENEVMLADFDLAGGTVGLNFNQEPTRGINEALFAPEKLDETYLDRLLTKCTDHLNLLAAPAMLDRTYDFTSQSVDALIEAAQKSVPYMVGDLPYGWTSWAESAVVSADEVVITTTPDLAGLRNAKNLFDNIKQQRKTDPIPHVILNNVGRSKDTEIRPSQFEDALEIELAAVMPFEPSVFGTAMNNGQMIEESSPKSSLINDFRQLAGRLTGRTTQTTAENKSSLMPLLNKLRGSLKKAS